MLIQIHVPANAVSNTLHNLYTVPAGKQFIIHQYHMGRTVNGNPDQISAYLLLTIGTNKVILNYNITTGFHTKGIMFDENSVIQGSYGYQDNVTYKYYPIITGELIDKI